MTETEQHRVEALTAAIADACDDHFAFEILIAFSTTLGRVLVTADDALAEDTLSRFCESVRGVRRAAAESRHLR